MKKNDLLKSLLKTAGALDDAELYTEADDVFAVMKAIAEDYDEYNVEYDDMEGELDFDNPLGESSWSDFENDEEEDYGISKELDEVDISNKMLNRLMMKEERDIERSISEAPLDVSDEEPADIMSSIIEDLYATYKTGDFTALRGQIEMMVPKEEWPEVMKKVREFAYRDEISKERLEAPPAPIEQPKSSEHDGIRGNADMGALAQRAAYLIRNKDDSSLEKLLNDFADPSIWGDVIIAAHTILESQGDDADDDFLARNNGHVGTGVTDNQSSGMFQGFSDSYMYTGYGNLEQPSPVTSDPYAI